MSSKYFCGLLPVIEHMITETPVDLSRFFVAGINYKKADVAIRGLYAINRDSYLKLFSLAPRYRIEEFFVLSTCNRTEIYGFASDPSSLIELLCSQTEGSAENFIASAYVKSGKEAVEHLFGVAAGLDSQILGDYEITGQIKQAARLSKQNKCIGSYLERIINGVLQSSKEIRTTTKLSEGTVSVSFAAIQFIRERMADFRNKKILLVGAGKIGRNTGRNLVDYLQTRNITLINRTPEKAVALAGELGLTAVPFEQLGDCVNEADIILVATDATEPVISGSQLASAGEKLLIDLSVPYNVEKEAGELENVTLINVDDLSRIKDETLQNRLAEVPAAKAIVAKYVREFFDWHHGRRHVRLLKAVKNKLEMMHDCNLYTSCSSTQHTGPSRKDPARIQRVINGMAVKMRQDNRQGCFYIEAINEYMATGTN